MSTTLTNDIAAIIREVDGDNALSAAGLGFGIASIPAWGERFPHVWLAHLVTFVERTNPDKQMSAGRLAELIVAEFLDREN